MDLTSSNTKVVLSNFIQWFNGDTINILRETKKLNNTAIKQKIYFKDIRKGEMILLKAILKNDINYPITPVFTFNSETGNFEHEEFFYHFAIVMNDPSWQVYATDGKLVYPIQNMDRADEESIFGLMHDDDDSYED